LDEIPAEWKLFFRSAVNLTMPKRGMVLGKVAYAKEFPEAAATLSHMEIALESGAVISRIVH
jgi:hypothetical protein